MGDAPGASPLALVLSGGGARAAYQVGVLAALAERVPALTPPIITGVSAGAINAMYLAARAGPFAAAVSQLADEWRRLTVDRVVRVRPLQLGRAAIGALLTGRRARPARQRGLLDTAPLRRFLTAAIEPRGIDTNLTSGRLRAVALTATAYGTGQTVSFVQAPPTVAMWTRARRVARHARLSIDHVMASAAIPLLFPAVRIGDEFFGDGSVRLTAPLAPAIHLGARAILAIGLRPADPDVAVSPAEYPSAAESLGLVLHSIFLDALDADAERLERLNRVVTALPPGTPVPEDLRPLRLLVLRPSRDLAALASGQLPRLPRLVRLVVQRLGGQRIGAAGFLSYLLFDPAYTTRLMELGYEDVAREWPRVVRFLAAVDRRVPAGG